MPYNLEAYTYAVPAYDKKALPGYMKSVEVPTNIAIVTRYEDPYITMFSDDNPNPNACSIM
ncbi:Heavy metal-associated isoprenylated plant protein 26 [Spatholobus suberectus]|nr:Heavy metal-associated isoprenylated plant protein 26 [Spatholobus suberectus]